MFEERLAEANRRLPIYTAAVEVLTGFLRTLESSPVHPEIVDRAGHEAVRYVKKSPEEALLLKFARLVSFNDTLLMLVERGKVLEQGTIQRSIEEANEDIAFICLNLTGQEESSKFRSFLKEFWKEDYADPANPVGSRIKRGYTQRKGIRSYINRALNQPDPSTADEIGRSIYEMYSGFLHGAAPQILEIYNFDEARFETSGITGTNRHLDYVFDAQNSVYRSLLSMGMIAKAFGSQELFDVALQHRDKFESLIGRANVVKEPANRA